MELPLPRRALDVTIRPLRTLWLLSAAHAVNHAHAALMPLVFLVVIDELRISVGEVAYLAAFGSFLAGAVQLTYAATTRYVSRRNLLSAGGLVLGSGMALQALATNFLTFSTANIASRLGGTPQHPVGNALLAEQFPERRRAFAISAHIAGGNLGTVAIPLVGAWLIAGIGWRWTVVLFGAPAILIALAMLVLVRETGADRAAARAEGSVRSAFGAVLRDRDLRWVYLSSMLGGGGRGLGVLNLFVPLYLSRVLGLDTGTVALMYTVLLLGSVPAPLIAGWLADRVGHKLMIVAIYLAGAAALVFFVLAGSNMALVWLGIVLLSAFTFVESPQLQALLADIARPGLRDVSFATYFTLAFGVGSLWTALYGAIIDASGEATGIPLTFWLMAAAFLGAAIAILPVRRTNDGTAEPGQAHGRPPSGGHG